MLSCYKWNALLDCDNKKAQQKTYTYDDMKILP